ncbi:XRE family transcriptional regulator [bacterium D16-50]|jgi:putative transcriptional regulator|nr:helix-turn-helix transcriptional regulator [Lachnospiraceae bacterium]RKJ18051.1 XRE family transcriptional regulator [bacterium D16-50]
MAKMGKGESVSIDVLACICRYMDCDIGDIMSFEKTDREEVPSNGSK